MGENVIGESAGEVFALAVDLVMNDGATVRPRGEPTREVLGVHLRLRRPRARLVHLPPARVLNPAFAAAEAVWVLSGSDEPWIFTYNERLRAYADDGVLQGADGPRLRRWNGTLDQLRRVVELVHQDRRHCRLRHAHARPFGYDLAKLVVVRAVMTYGRVSDRTVTAAWTPTTLASGAAPAGPLHALAVRGLRPDP